MAYNWQAQANVHGSPSQALLDVQQQQQQQQRHNMVPLQHHASYYGPTSNNAVSSSTMDGMAQMGAGSGMVQGSSAPSNADIDAIWSNYQPNKIPISFNGMPPSQGQQFMMQQQRPNSDASTAAASMNNFTPMSAAAAAAAYGQLGFPAPQQAGMSNEGMSAQWNGSSNNTGMGFQSAGGLVAPPKRLAHLSSSNVGYEGDASNSSSTQTPGASSGDDSNGEKRKQQQALSGGGGGGGASAMHRVGSGQTFTQHTLNGVEGQFDSSNVSTRRGSLDMKMGLNPDAAAGSRPLLKHRRSHSGSQVPSSNNAYSDGNVLMSKRLSIHGQPLHQQHSTSVIASMAPYAQSLSGHAASHPPGLGNNILRGVDVGTGGSQAATGFTKRKGWYNRIVDELLDFVHVLDAQGRILYAASSVGTLTGWNLEELRGKKIESLIHPDDAPAFMQELKRCFRDGGELTTYYRFRKKPKTAADKQRVRDQRAASNAGQSNSASTSENDSSSNQEPTSKTKFADGLPEDNVDLLYDDDADLSDDRDDRYVIFEITGHPYVAPNEGEDATAKKLDGSPTKSPARTKSTDATLKAKKSAETVAGSADAKDDTKAAAVGDIPKDVQCFFCSGRVYPTKTVGMLDSFLEYKLENERLRMLLSELSVNDGSGANFGETSSSDGRRSLEGYPLDYPRDHDGQTNSIGHGAASLGSVETVEAATTTTMANGTGYEGSSNAMGNHRKPSTNDVAAAMSSPVSPRTSAAAGGASVPPAAGSAYDSDDKEDYDSNGNMSPSLDALGGVDDDNDDKPKKKKPKAEEGDYVCTDCGRVDSPEWRKGPLGPKTLCNACGLRWAKKVKRSGGDPNAVSKAGAAMKKGQLMAAQMSSTGSQGGGGGGVQIQQPGMPVNLMQQQMVNGNSFVGVGGGSSTMSRPSLSSSNTGSSASMYGHMPSFGQMAPGPGPPHNTAMFDHSVMGGGAGGPPQNMYGVHHNMAPDVYGAAGGGAAPPPGMPPLIHHGSSFMSQSSASAPAHPSMTFQQQQQQQQFQQPNNNMGGGGGAPPPNMMPNSANNAAMFVNMHSGMPDYNQMG